ncbi:MAG: recombination mediator RecR [Pseudomonadota bacterium]|nr:recombination mediator RecR [Pseudomonadota bacterium]
MPKNILPQSFSSLMQKLQVIPGVGPKSASKIALHFIQKAPDKAKQLALQINQSLDDIRLCSQCRHLADAQSTICNICSDTSRQQNELCILESITDLIAMESTQTYKGLYFVLHEYLSPIDRIGPEEIGIPLLLDRLNKQPIQEIIFATNRTIEGQATTHYIIAQLKDKSIKLSQLASGIPFGTDFEFVNQHTLHDAMINRNLIASCD